MIQPPPQSLRRRSRRAAAFAVAAFAPLTALAGAIPVGASYATYDNALFNGVVSDTVGRITYGFSGSASGVYLGDGWVLTAAHVGDDDFDFDFTLQGNTYASANVTLHPEWNHLDIGEGHDLALIQLTQNIPSNNGATLFTGTTNQLLGTTATIAGYGATGNGNTGGTGAPGTLHAGQNRIDRTGAQSPFGSNHDATVFADFDNPNAGSDGYSWSPDNALTYEYMITAGDSGGGLFTDPGNGLQLAGVTSFLLADDGNPNGDYGDIGAFFTLDRMLPWIAQTTGNDVLLPGDANANGQIEQADLDAVLQNWGQSNQSWSHGDLNGNGQVEQADLDLVLQNWGQSTAPNFQGFSTSPVPEPATALLLLTPALLARHRRR